jgi:hypothetical protein
LSRKKTAYFENTLEVFVFSVDQRLARLGTAVPEILLPRPGTDLRKWAVVACDQFTQDSGYWEAVKAEVGGAPSTLNLIFPELYLEKDREARIRDIRRSMEACLEGGVFAPPRRCCVSIERASPRHPRRRGLMLAVDLEQYDWNPGERPLIRTTEGTIRERLTPRMEIRRGALLEIPHILLLIDDEDDVILPALGERAKKQAALYDTPLMMNSGSVSGWALDKEEDLAFLAEGLEGLAQKASVRYGTEDAVPFLYAVGDGNHSLAAAKEIWEEYKRGHGDDKALMDHPARWALVELENLYDLGISFEPIHRVIFGAREDELVRAFAALPPDLGYKAEPGIIRIETKRDVIATAALQPLLDDFVRDREASIDYIHGEEELCRLASDASRPAVGILLPPIQKKGLFKTTAQTGPLPRKSFSMGAAAEKRFYLECRKLFGRIRP